MEKIKNDMEQAIIGKKAVFLFTGSNGSSLLIDIVMDMNVNIVFIDTGYHFNEITEYVQSYGSKIEIIKNNDPSAEPSVDLSKCCEQRKAEVLKEYLKNIECECVIVPFTDNEHDNSIEDSYLKGLDNISVIKPLAHLSEKEIWIKIKENKLPFSKIYTKGYRVIDCMPCTTRQGRKKQSEVDVKNEFDEETKEKLKSLGYM